MSNVSKPDITATSLSLPFLPTANLSEIVKNLLPFLNSGVSWLSGAKVIAMEEGGRSEVTE